MTNVFVLDKSFQLISVIDRYTSLIWSTRFLLNGDFELCLAHSPEVLNYLQIDSYLVREQDVLETDDLITLKNIMIIEKIEIKNDVENGNYINVTGRCLKSLLKRRVILGFYSKEGIEASTLIEDLVNENIADKSTVDMMRRIPGFIVIPSRLNLGTTNVQYFGDNLGDIIETLCTTYSVGYEIYVMQNKDNYGNITKTNIYFKLKKGIDRSRNQSLNAYVEFSRNYDNLLTTNYSLNKQDYKNVAFVGGEGEGIDRYYDQFNHNRIEGIERREVFVDAPDISAETGEVITDQMYYEYLKEKGFEALKGLPIVESFDGTVVDGLTYKLNQDYYLGDTVQIVNEHGIEGSPQILEIIESENENGKTTILTFNKLEV